MFFEYLNSGPSKGDIELNADDSVYLAGELFSGDIGQIIAGDDLCIRADDDIRLLGSVIAGGDINLCAEQGVEIAGAILAGDDILIKTDHGDVVINGAVQAGDRLDVSAGMNLIIGAPLKAGGDLDLYAKGSLKTNNALATLTAGMNVVLGTCRGDIELFGAITAGAGYTPCSSKHCCWHQEKPDVVINAGGAIGLHGAVTSVDDVVMFAWGDIEVSDTIAAGDEIHLSTFDDITLLPGSLLTGILGKKARLVYLAARDQVTLQGTINADKLVVIPKARCFNFF